MMLYFSIFVVTTSDVKEINHSLVDLFLLIPWWDGLLLVKIMKEIWDKICLIVKVRSLSYILSPFSGPNYAACLKDSSSGGGERSELVIFSSSTPGNLTREQCNSVCFAASHRYGGLGAKHECLCSTNSEPNFISKSQCSAACTDDHVMKVHRSPT